MRHLHIAGMNYILDEAGQVIAAIKHKRLPSIDPQLALKWARLVYDRTLVDKHPGFGGPAMAKFTTEQHLLRYTGENRQYRLSPIALKRIQAVVATW